MQTSPGMTAERPVLPPTPQHPLSITLGHTASPSGSGRLPVSATLLAWCLVIPTAWMTAMVLLALAVRY